MGTSQVTVVGAGVIGLCTAWQLARDGVSVTLVDPHPGSGASAVAAGMLAPVTETGHPESGHVRLLLEAASRWPAFAAALGEATGRDIGYRAHGTLVVATDASDRRVVDDLLDLHRSLGLHVESLTARACREHLPYLAPGIHGGAWIPGDHRVDNHLLLEALRSACIDAGVRLHVGHVSEVARAHNGDVAGVVTRDGSRIDANTVVLAAGTATSAIAASGAFLPDIRPVKGIILRLRRTDPVWPMNPALRAWVRGRTCYLVPRDEGVMLLGATCEERGFDSSIPAGQVRELLDDARAVLPIIDETTLEEWRVGFRPTSADLLPCVGVTGIPGLLLASAHYRNGMLLAPLTAEAISALVRGQDMPTQMSVCTPRRFSTATRTASRSSA